MRFSYLTIQERFFELHDRDDAGRGENPHCNQKVKDFMG